MKEKVKELPLKPGVYFYKNSRGKIIYIGKAKSLRKRVSSYFTKTHYDKTALLVEEARDIDFIVTDSEVEALILEARLIRQHKPKYNIDLKDGTRYAFLKVTGEEFPRLLTTRQKKKDKAKYFGPYTDGTARENSARLLRTIFKIRTCKKLPKTACLQYYIGNCDAPCIGNISKEEYESNMKSAIKVLQGRNKQVIKELQQEMVKFSDQKKYEFAKKRRDQIRSLRQFNQRQKIAMHKSYNEDVLNYIQVADKIFLQLFRVEKGNLNSKQEFTFDESPEIIESFIKQYYATNEIPDAILVPHKLVDHDLIESYLTKQKGKRVQVKLPKKGRRKKLLDLVYTNISHSIEQEDRALVNLKDHLNLSGVPYVIECFDISTILGEYTVASMVQFRGGKPDKSNYRKFKIKTVKGQDDFASMAEVVRRRYSRLLNEKEELPNLIVIDGGKGQLSAAWQVLQTLGIKHIPVIGLAKKEEEIYRINQPRPLKINHKEPGLKLLQQIRDEAHRFAITYHRLLRKKGMTQKK